MGRNGSQPPGEVMHFSLRAILVNGGFLIFQQCTLKKLHEINDLHVKFLGGLF